MTLATGRIHQGDCLALLDRLEPGSVQLAFADPPFNIGYQYDQYDDRRTSDDYLDWSRKWMAGVVRALADDGTFWLAIGDEYAAELKVIATGELGLTMRSWVVWYYTFGVNCTRKFSRSHAHLFHFVKDPRHFTFNADDPHVRVPSARALVYGDRRANPAGRLPDDTWILRPQDLPDGFQPTDDTWYFARVAGTFKEREGFHGCQMPEQLLGRIIRISSNGVESPESRVQSPERPESRARSSEATLASQTLDTGPSTLDSSDLVLDPFAGSGTTLAVAKKLGRRWIGFELSADYATYATERLEQITPGDPLDGPENPLTSAPSTRNGVRLELGKRLLNSSESAIKIAGSVRPYSSANGKKIAQSSDKDVRRAIEESYLAASKGCSVDRILADPDLASAFADECRKRGIPGAKKEWNRSLLRIRKSGLLPRSNPKCRVVVDHATLDQYSFASEIALQMMIDQYQDLTLDELLCDQKLAREFDKIARRLAPGHKPFDYRWAALRIRKMSADARRDASALRYLSHNRRFSPSQLLTDLDFDKLRDVSGLYLVKRNGKKWYLGETLDLASRLELHVSNPVHIFEDAMIATLREEADLFARKYQYLMRDRPKWNIHVSSL